MVEHCKVATAESIQLHFVRNAVPVRYFDCRPFLENNFRGKAREATALRISFLRGIKRCQRLGVASLATDIFAAMPTSNLSDCRDTRENSTLCKGTSYY